MACGRSGSKMKQNSEEKKPSLITYLKQDIAPILKLNLIFILSCLPLLSIPAAIQSMTEMNLRLQDGENVDVWSDYWHAFRVNFIRATLEGLLLAALFLVLGYVAWFYQKAEADNLILIFIRYASLVPVIILYVASCYFWCLGSMTDMGTVNKFRNSIRLTIVCIRPTLLCLLAGILFGGIAFLGVPYSTPFLFVGAFSLWNYISTWYAGPMVDIYILGNSPNMM